VRTPLDPERRPRSNRAVPRRAGAGTDRTTEARIYTAALRQTTVDQRHAMAEALAQAEIFIEELADQGRYSRNATPEDRESDRLRLALALMRARRGGFEDGALLQAWWRDSVDGSDGSVGDA
jgi:hypothetical protein